MTSRAWLGHVGLFFAFAFALHGAGLLLHEFGGHALTMSLLGSGVERTSLTFFGHGQVFGRSGPPPSLGAALIIDWSGLVLCTGGAALLWWRARRSGRGPLARLCGLLAAYFVLLGQLGYVVAGGFHGLHDPGRAARLLGARGLGWLVWAPGLLAYAAVAWFSPAPILAAFAGRFACRSRAQTARRAAATLGLAGALYAAALQGEASLRPDALRPAGELARVRAEAALLASLAEAEAAGRVVSPQERARLFAAARPFPVDHLLVVIAALGLGAALLRQPAVPPGPPPDPERGAVLAVCAAAALAAMLLAALGAAG